MTCQTLNRTQSLMVRYKTNKIKGSLQILFRQFHPFLLTCLFGPVFLHWDKYIKVSATVLKSSENQHLLDHNHHEGKMKGEPKELGTCLVYVDIIKQV